MPATRRRRTAKTFVNPCCWLGGVLWIAFSTLAVAADRYVDPLHGADGNDGSLALPWQHLRHAAGKVRPGDTVFLRKGTYRGDSIFTVTHGTAERPITFRAYPGERPVITGSGIYDQVFHLNNDHYVIAGLTFEDTACYNVLYLNGSRRVVIRDCRFRKQTGTMVLLRGGGYHTIEKNTFDTTGSPAGGGDGDHVYVAGSHHNLIQENHFVRAGHAACDQIESGSDKSHHNVLRNNLIEQHWGGGLYVIRGSSRSLLEGNRIYYAGEEMEYPKCGIQLAAGDNVARRNLIVRTGANPHRHDGLLLAGYRFSGIDQHAVNNCVYNNVLYRVGRTAIAVTQKGACSVTRNKVLNNVVYRGRVGGPKEPFWPAGNYYFTFETYHAFAGNKWAKFPNGNFFHHNLVLHADERGDRPGEDPLIFFEQEKWGHSLPWVEERFPRNFYANSEQNPKFVDADAGDFRLQAGSPAIDAGDFLTRTTAAGANTAQVPVSDASFFCDGWERIEPDMIQVGANRPVRAVKVDYSSNVITLGQPISFAAGEPVSLPWHGAAPDLGAFEYAPPTARPLR